VTVPPMRPPSDRWWLVALDVGQGDALAIGFADGWWLVDAGPRTERIDAGRRVVLPFMRWAGIGRLTCLVVTHDDSDHTGGAPSVRAAMAVDRVLAPVPLPHVPGPLARFHARAVAAGDTLARQPRVVACWPPRGFDASADNAAGLVLEVGEGRARALLTADVDSTIEALMLPSLDIGGRLEVLKAGHHGSASSSGTTLLTRLSPRLTVLSCGRHNAFGHPAPVTLERLAAAGTIVRRTDREGSVWLELSDAGARVVDWRHGEPRPASHEVIAVATARAGEIAALHPVARPWPRW
ncbi:MAG: ComEC/Rec2 family competence protein, partial [Candidatus Eisenbacteria bacterium]